MPSLSGPTVWLNTYAICGSLHQSPIDIDTHDVHEHDMESFHFDHYDDTSVTMTMENTGHSGKRASEPAPICAESFAFGA